VSGEKLAALAEDLKERAASRTSQGEVQVDNSIAESLVDVGMITPVTKRSAGKQYQQELARQLCSFLAPLLRKERGMMVLHDVYCVFNRCEPWNSETDFLGGPPEEGARHDGVMV
jgi:hypothetical protein